MINKSFLVNLKSNKFATLLSKTIEIWKWEYNMFNFPRDYEIKEPGEKLERSKLWRL